MSEWLWKEDGLAYGKCRQCEKVFHIQPANVFKIYVNGTYHHFCSYKCFRKNTTIIGYTKPKVEIEEIETNEALEYIFMKDEKIHSAEIGRNLREIMDDQGFNLKRLSSLSEVGVPTLKSYIAGTKSMNIYNAIKICCVLNVSLNRLFLER